MQLSQIAIVSLFFVVVVKALSSMSLSRCVAVSCKLEVCVASTRLGDALRRVFNLR